MSEKWIVDVRPMTWEEKESPACDFCENKLSKYWVEEFAMGLCGDCHMDLRNNCLQISKNEADQ